MNINENIYMYLNNFLKINMPIFDSYVWALMSYGVMVCTHAQELGSFICGWRKVLKITEAIFYESCVPAGKEGSKGEGVES